MDTTTIAGLIGLGATVVNVVISVAVGSWARRRQVTDDAQIKTEGSAVAELQRRWADDRRRIERLEKRLDGKDTEIKSLNERLSAANVTIATQAGMIADLTGEVARLTREGRGAA